MPSFQWFKPFSKKKSHWNKNHGYGDIHGYPTATPPPQAMMSHQHQHPYHQPPPHSLSQRQHFYPQQIIMQSPQPQQPAQNQHHQIQHPHMQPQNHQLHNQQQHQHQHQHQHQLQSQVNTATTNSSATLASANNQHHYCPCQQCSFQQQPQQPQMNHVNGANQLPFQHNQHPQQHVQQQVHNHNHLQSPPTQMLGQTQLPNSMDGQVGPIISPQQQPMTLQLQPTTTLPHQQQQQHQPIHQPCQLVHQTSPQQPQQAYHCQNSTYNTSYMNQSLASIHPQGPQSPPQVIVPQCTCQLCPYQQQQQQAPSSQQQPMQQLDHTQTNGTCQHGQVSNNTLLHNNNNNNNNTYINGNQQMVQQQSHITHNHLGPQQHHTNQICPSHPPQQTAPLIMTSSTPGLQHHQPAFQTHQSNFFSSNQQPYHTIQPDQYQQQKQQMQHQHHRVQSLHQQQTHTIQQQTHRPSQAGQQHMAQSQNHLNYQDHLQKQQQHPQQFAQKQPCQQDESVSHDFSRYANMQSLMDDSSHTHKTDYSQSSKYQEHVYYNQKPELPSYEPPPDYETFMEHRKMYAIELNGQHMTHHSESMVLQRAKDSSYENLKTRFPPYSNLPCRQEPGFTS